MYIRIKFDIGGVGTVEQIINMDESNVYTADEIVELLEDGTFVTSIANGGKVFDLSQGFKQVGTIEGSHMDHDMEYSEFELLEEFKDE